MSLMRILAIAAIIFIPLLVLFPVLPLNFSYIPYFDKIAHFSVAAVLALSMSRFISIRKSVLITLLLLTGIEYAQTMMPNRNVEALDMVGNILGVLVAWFIHNSRLTRKLKAAILRS